MGWYWYWKGGGEAVGRKGGKGRGMGWDGMGYDREGLLVYFFSS